MIECVYKSELFSPGPPVSSSNKTDRHDITEILLNTIKQTKNKKKSTNFFSQLYS